MQMEAKFQTQLLTQQGMWFLFCCIFSIRFRFIFYCCLNPWYLVWISFCQNIFCDVFWHFGWFAVYEFDIRAIDISASHLKLCHCVTYFSSFNTQFTHNRSVWIICLLRCDVDVCLFFDFGCRSDFVNDRSTFEHIIHSRVDILSILAFACAFPYSVRRKHLNWFSFRFCSVPTIELYIFYLRNTNERNALEQSRKMPNSESSRHSFEEEFESLISGMIFNWIYCFPFLFQSI